MSTEEGQEAAVIKIQALHRGNVGRKRAEDRVEEIMTQEMENAAVKIQSIARGTSARKRTENKMEKMMEEELARNATKIQSLARGRAGRKKAENKMEELMENEMEAAATSVQAVFRGHVARKEAYTLMSADMERRMNETAERIGTYDKRSPIGSGGKRNDLVSHVLRLQERVKEIQHIVKSVVPVFSGDESMSPSPSISPTPSPTKLMTPKANQPTTKTPKQLSVAIVGLDGIGALASQIFVQAGVGKLFLLDTGNVEAWHVQHLIYTDRDLGKARGEAASEILASSATGTDISTSSANVADEGELGAALQSVDLVIDSSPEARMLLKKICEENQCTRVQCAIDGQCTFFQLHPPSTPVDEHPWPPETQQPVQSGFEWLVTPTLHACAGHMVQNSLKYLLGSGNVTASLQLNGSS